MEHKIRNIQMLISILIDVSSWAYYLLSIYAVMPFLARNEPADGLLGSAPFQ